MRLQLFIHLILFFACLSRPGYGDNIFATEYSTAIPGYLIAQVEEYLAGFIGGAGWGRRAFRTQGTVVPIGSFKPVEEDRLDVISKYRRDAVKNATRHAWDGYAKYAWGYDELRPVTKRGVDSFSPGLGTTILDSLSTLFLMGETDRYDAGREWVKNSLQFSNVGKVIVFETVIRILGGLISIYHMTGDKLYAEKAEELGVRLVSSFESPSGYPWPKTFLNNSNLRSGHDHQGDGLYLAEVGSVQLELRALAHLSDQALLKNLRTKSENIIADLQNASSHTIRLPERWKALLPFSLSLNSGKYQTNMVTLGAPADSYFEYLVKCWLQGGKKERKFWILFEQVMDGLTSVITYKSSFGDVIVRDVIPSEDGKTIQFHHKMDHFTCFIPGMIVLGIDGLPLSDHTRRRKWLKIAEDLTETCYKMYSRSPIGLAGENIMLSETDRWRMNGGYNLRPEAVEAMFYMWRFTKHQKYRDWAWEIFQNIEKHCRIDTGGYSAIRKAKTRHPRKSDIMHSFLIAETFKYLYLIFGPDDELPLDKWVFNTEAHPLIITPEISRSGGQHSFEKQELFGLKHEEVCVVPDDCMCLRKEISLMRMSKHNFY